MPSEKTEKLKSSSQEDSSPDVVKDEEDLKFEEVKVASEDMLQ